MKSMACSSNRDSVPSWYCAQMSSSSTTAKQGWNQRKYAPIRLWTTVAGSGSENTPSASKSAIRARLLSISHRGTSASALPLVGTKWRNFTAPSVGVVPVRSAELGSSWTYLRELDSPRNTSPSSSSLGPADCTVVTLESSPLPSPLTPYGPKGVFLWREANTWPAATSSGFCLWSPKFADTLCASDFLRFDGRGCLPRLLSRLYTESVARSLSLMEGAVLRLAGHIGCLAIGAWPLLHYIAFHPSRITGQACLSGTLSLLPICVGHLDT